MSKPLPRVRLRPAFVVMAMGCMTVFLAVPLVVAVVVLILAPPGVSVWVALAGVAFVAVIGYAMSSSVQWVELDGGVIRWRGLLTRRVREKPVGELVDALPLHSNLMGPLENAILDAMMKTSNRGYELRFRDGTKLGLVRGDMAGLDEFLDALAKELARTREEYGSAG
ncbi:hypothetical protein J0H58_31840 [bacterium]|nr:hypothetical protein [bacterium]